MASYRNSTPGFAGLLSHWHLAPLAPIPVTLAAIEFLTQHKANFDVFSDATNHAASDGRTLTELEKKLLTDLVESEQFAVTYPNKNANNTVRDRYRKRASRLDKKIRIKRKKSTSRYTVHDDECTVSLEHRDLKYVFILPKTQERIVGASEYIDYDPTINQIVTRDLVQYSTMIALSNKGLSAAEMLVECVVLDVRIAINGGAVADLDICCSVFNHSPTFISINTAKIVSGTRGYPSTSYPPITNTPSRYTKWFFDQNQAPTRIPLEANVYSPKFGTITVEPGHACSEQWIRFLSVPYDLERCHLQFFSAQHLVLESTLNLPLNPRPKT
jgi:hypothetical protein